MMIDMPTDHRALLSKIKRFDQLIIYLRDEMDWPIESDDLEELTFDYKPEELGIDLKNAAKIESIKRLRPLSPHQPWGIFFVKFEPKRLPVVVLRRILSQVSLKKRASAKNAERTAWAANDLLFVSNYGEGDDRTITFAHFYHDETKQDLPVLKVLGWNDGDTALHLDGVASELTTKLKWPSNESDSQTWRSQWQSAFTLRPREVITTSKDLSIRLAELARTIRKRINTSLRIENERGPLRKIMKAFREALIHELDADGFADMYAQTIAYGLLSARIANPKRWTADELHLQMPVTNPFLKEMMETFLKIGGRRGDTNGHGIDFDELGVNEVVDLLDNSNMEAVIRDFGDRNPQEDPVIHFYELFLEEYDANMRVQRGVFYTPRPIVSYIIRSVDEILRTEFGLQDGLADTTTWKDILIHNKDLKIPKGTSPDEPFVQILDPATGTGTFLVEIIDQIYITMREKWNKQNYTEKKIEELWNAYVPNHLLPRLHGFELLMAPYAIAHLKIGIKLYETGYHFNSEERVRVYLTNSLEPASDTGQLTLTGIFKAIAHEAQAVNEIKRNQRFTVVIGNPPYSNYGQLNKTQFILELLEDYKRDLNEKKINLNDDFIKFLRYSQFQLEQTGVGTIGLVTNNTYLDGITHRRLREYLLTTFNDIRILNLHGSSNKQERCPDGSKDENVFDIKQGVSIATFSRLLRKKCDIAFSELWGLREKKYQTLLKKEKITPEYTLEPSHPNFFFVPKNFDFATEYNLGISVTDLFDVFGSSVKTDRDELFIDHDKNRLLDRMKIFYSSKGLSEPFRSEYRIEDSSSYKLLARRRQTIFNEKNVVPCFYRPFDKRWIYYSPKLTSRPGNEVMQHMLMGPNLGFITSRTVYGADPWRDAMITNTICEFGIMATRPGNTAPVFPLYIYKENNNSKSYKKSYLNDLTKGRPNFTNLFLKLLSERLGLQQVGEYEIPYGLTPEDILHYMYAVFYSPCFRSRYAEFLKIDFPRLPLTSNLDLFHDLANIGRELVSLHLMESSKLEMNYSTYLGPKNPEIEKISYSNNTLWIDKAQTMGFQGVPENVWNFYIGGYQVCEKWLKDRKGRILLNEDITLFQKIILALTDTIILMQKVDNVIEHYGGWPNAFQTINH